MPIRRILAISVAIFALDRLIKIWVLDWLDLENRLAIDVWPPYLNLRLAWNQGINFGLFAAGSDITRWILISVGLAISLALLIWFRNARELGVQVSVGLVVGGAISNILDRLSFGAVVDFLNVSCCGISNPFVFNTSDMWIFLGVIGLIILDGKKPGEKPGKKRRG